MFTYHLQERVCRLRDANHKLVFPGQLKARIQFTPKHAFLDEIAWGRTILAGAEPQMLFNANTGRCYVKSETSPIQIETLYRSPNQRFYQHGSLLTVEHLCNDWSDLYNLLFSFAFVYPSHLNLCMPEPVRADRIEGELNGIPFGWEFDQVSFPFAACSQGTLEQGCMDAFETMGTLSPNALSALHYLHKASRLMATTDAPGEIMGEVILNLVRTLQSMFGESIDAVREGLASLDFPKDRIESDFVPLMFLRNRFDVGHIKHSVPRHDDLEWLFRYIECSEIPIKEAVRKWLKTDAAKIDRESRPEDLEYDNQSKRDFDRIIESIKKSSQLRMMRTRQDDGAGSSSANSVD